METPLRDDYPIRDYAPVPRTGGAMTRPRPIATAPPGPHDRDNTFVRSAKNLIYPVPERNSSYAAPSTILHILLHAGCGTLVPISGPLPNFLSVHPSADSCPLHGLLHHASEGTTTFCLDSQCSGYHSLMPPERSEIG